MAAVRCRTVRKIKGKSSDCIPERLVLSGIFVFVWK
ncbi:MAG TPA: hypothetical protein DCY37_06110 [Acidaminococcaceae bacterium]|nr:hypothetical protein [Acidaminococcaceae bacterium]